MSERNAVSSMSVEEYLAFEADSTVRHEYVDGHVFDMTGATLAHNVICVNLLTMLHARLRGTGCRAYVNDVKVHIKAANSFYYPDIMVTCEPFVPDSVVALSPALIVEVLSPSTRQIDRREKLVAYRKLDSLREYLIVHQNKMLLELYLKDGTMKWQMLNLKGSEELSLETLPGGPLKISAADLYEGLELPVRVKEEEEEYEFAGRLSDTAE